MARISITAKTAWNTQRSFMLGISMGSQNHEGEALKAIVDRINSSNFSSGVIDLADTLNRYRYIAEGKSETEAIVITKTQGDEWLERNKYILSQLTVPSVVHRWDEWLNHSSYQKTLEHFQNLYDNNPALRAALDKDIEKFYIRNYGTIDISESSYSLSKAYYLEEIVVAAIMLNEQPSIVLYPGKQLECFKLIRSGKISEIPAPLLNSPYSRLILHSFDRSPLANHNNSMIAA